MRLIIDALISPLALAPMIDWTTTHFRMLMRFLAPHALLYTEMQTTQAVLYNPERALQRNAHEAPLALQLGGHNKQQLARCASLAQDKGFCEVNLNLGCPSSKVLAGRFGACLMREPKLVTECIQAMKAAVSIPVTAKVRIGIDENDSYAFFKAFVCALLEGGCDKLIVHARKAWLHGLNPKQNRTIPPINYDYVYKIKQEFKDLPVVINGNISDLADLTPLHSLVDGVMIGRLACQNPYAFASFHQVYYPHVAKPSRMEVLKRYYEYIENQFEQHVPLSLLLKPLFNFNHGLPYAKRWKHELARVQKEKTLKGLETAFDLLVQI